MSLWTERKRQLIQRLRAERIAKHGSEIVRNPRLTEDQYEAIIAKVDREFPVRVKLAKLLGVPKLIGSPLGGESIGSLYLHIVLWAPDKAPQALELVRSVWSFSQELDRI